MGAWLLFGPELGRHLRADRGRLGVFFPPDPSVGPLLLLELPWLIPRLAAMLCGAQQSVVRSSLWD